MRLHASHAGPDEKCCVRCKRNREAFCIKQEKIEQAGKEGEYVADGVDEECTREKVEELFEDRERERDLRVRWALPVACEEHRERIDARRWKWKVEEEEKDAEGSGDSIIGKECLHEN
jgi:hypothetical protein